MSRYIPNQIEIDACQFRAFDRDSHIKSEIEDGADEAFANRSADRAERRHNEEESLRVKFAIEKCNQIRSSGRKYAQRFWR